MSGHTKWQAIRDRARKGPDHEARSAQIRHAYRDILGLAELRSSRGVTQAELAKEMDVSQVNVSRLEREDDLYLSTLARYILSLGGELRIEAVFPEGPYTLMDLGPDGDRRPLEDVEPNALSHESATSTAGPTTPL